MKISLIVAASLNYAIGKNNQLLWHLPVDLKFFKNTTWAMPVVMGRKTFESVNCKPLNGRWNIILSQNLAYQPKGVDVVQSLEEAIQLVQSKGYYQLFVCGGGLIYKQAMPLATDIYFTRVQIEVEGDTYFPAIDENLFQKNIIKVTDADEKNRYACSFEHWVRK